MFSGLNGKQITVLIGGSIAAYKSAELVRELVKAGAGVHVVMSAAAREFITPLTLQTLSKNPVTTDLFDPAQEGQIGHIRLADESDAIVVAPATADLIAKAAAGIADSPVTAVLLATKAPIVFAPAMNVNMWQNPITQRNIETLKSFGIRILEPDDGELACGWHGPGRLPETGRIIEELEVALTPKDLLGVSVVITAGPTREPLDPIRFLSNRSSGKMGFAIARVAKRRGAEVTLISGPTNLEAPVGVKFIPVQTAAEMGEKLFAATSEVLPPQSNGSLTLVFMVSAVMDYRASEVSDKKLKHDKQSEISLTMLPNADILKELGTRRKKIAADTGRVFRLVGFNAETGDVESLLQSAREKLKRKQIDLIVANLAADAFERDTNRVWLVDAAGREEEVGTANKMVVAERIINRATEL